MGGRHEEPAAGLTVQRQLAECEPRRPRYRVRLPRTLIASRRRRRARRRRRREDAHRRKLARSFPLDMAGASAGSGGVAKAQPTRSFYPVGIGLLNTRASSSPTSLRASMNPRSSSRRPVGTVARREKREAPDSERRRQKWCSHYPRAFAYEIVRS